MTETTDLFDGSGPACMYADWKCTSNASCDNECAPGADLSWCKPACMGDGLTASEWATWCEDYTKWYPGVPEIVPLCRAQPRCDGSTPCAVIQQRTFPDNALSIELLRCRERELRFLGSQSDGVGGVCLTVCTSDDNCLAWSPGVGSTEKACRRLANAVLISTGLPGEPSKGTRYLSCVGECEIKPPYAVDFPPLFVDAPCTPGAITILEEPATPTAGR